MEELDGLDFVGCYQSFWVKGWGVQLIVVVVVVVFVGDCLQVIVFVLSFEIPCFGISLGLF